MQVKCSTSEEEDKGADGFSSKLRSGGATNKGFANVRELACSTHTSHSVSRPGKVLTLWLLFTCTEVFH